MCIRDRLWDQIVELCTEEPAIEIRCGHLWDTFMEARCAMANVLPFLQELAPQAISRKYPQMQPDDV
eukprot:1127208-Pyramimonas_sp.AAC.1